jgi:LPXTG-site transpeptidase (sortase) family protein
VLSVGVVMACASSAGDQDPAGSDPARPTSTGVASGSTAGPPHPAATAGTPASQTRSFIPSRLTLPSGAVAPVDPAGVGTDGVLQVPDDAGRVGWWTGGARAGEPFGSIVLAGHVDSRVYGLGVFSELLSVEVGDEVTLDDGSDFTRYRVSELKQAPKSRLAGDTAAFRQDVDNRLVLITCVGPYDHRLGAYPDNLVVIADEID